MANYIFETITPAQAASFTAGDRLFFSNQATTPQTVTVTPFDSGSGSLSQSGITITAGGTSVTFPNSIATASQNGDVVFLGSSGNLVLGTNDATAVDTLTSTSVATDTGANSTVIYALGGDDTITGGAGADYVYGGTGDDTINGADGNYHIYGNAAGSPVALATGQTDVDTITVGGGSNYIQGNAGDDIITAGTATSTGNNRIFGGADDDTITVNGGQGAIAQINGNRGDDTISLTGSGTYSARGGMGDDTITQTGANRSIIQGDLGNDTIVVSGTAGHVAVLTGGAGDDVFDFSTAGAGAVATLNSAGVSVAVGTAGASTFYQTITDLGNGADTIDIGATVDAIGTASTTFATVNEAAIFAETQLGTTNAAGNTIDVSALSVGNAGSAQTYLFYDDGAALGVINVSGTAATSITADTFA